MTDLRSELEAETRIVDDLVRVGPLLAAELDPDRLVQQITDEATQLVRAQFGAFFYNIVNASGESFLLYTISGVPREAFSKFPMPRNTAVFAPTFNGEGVVRVDDITKDARYGHNAPHHGMPAGHLPVRSYLAAPVRSLAGQVIGGLFFGHEKPGVFTARDERALAALIAMAGATFTNAQLFKRLGESETALRTSERRYRLIAEAAQDGIWSWEVGASAVDWNDRLLAMLGLDRASWGGTFDDWFARVHPEDQPRMSAAIQDHLERKVPYRVEQFRLRHADGRYLWCSTVAQAEWDESGKPVRMAGSVRDVTARKLELDAQRLLAEAAAILGSSIDYSTTLANVARAVVPTFADWCAVDVVSDGAVKRLAVTHVDPAKVQLAHDLDRRYPPDPNAPTGVFNVLRTKQTEHVAHIPDELLVAGARDEEHLAISRALGLHSYICVPVIVNDEAIGVITFVTAESKRTYVDGDIVFAEELARRAAVAIENATLYEEARRAVEERDRALAEVRDLAATLEQRVNDRTAALREANKELESFSYTVSHDLRAPVRHIGGFVDLLRNAASDKLDDRALRYLDTIKTSASQMGMLIDGLLAFSRLGRTELGKRPVDLGSVVRDVVRELEPDLAKRNVTWAIGDLPMVAADPTMIRLVVANFVANAVKYTRTRAEAKIEVASKREGDEIVFWVTDNGVGFNMAYQEKLFGVFQRLHNDAQFEGTGIGLATARRIVHRHGGRVWARGAEGEGATFYFSLPHKDLPA